MKSLLLTKNMKFISSLKPLLRYILTQAVEQVARRLASQESDL